MSFDQQQIQHDQQALAQRMLDELKGLGATAADVFVQRGEGVNLKIREGETTELRQRSPQGIGFRYFDGQRSAFAYSSDLNFDTLKELAASTKARAAFAPESQYDALADVDPSTISTNDEEEAEAFGSISIDEKLAYCREIEQVALDYDKRIFTTEPTAWADGISVSTVANSNGVLFSRTESTSTFYTAPVAEADGKKVRDFRGMMRLKWADRPDPAMVGREAAERAVSALGARKVESGNVPVILTPEAGADFLGRIIGAFSGDAVSKNMSFLADKLGEKIGAKGFSIVDDPTLEGGFNSCRFDDEGQPTSKKYLIRDGVLETFLYDARTARKANTESTGSGFRGGYKSLPSISTTNLFIEPGELTKDELFSKVERGFMATKFVGFGVDNTRGDLSVGCAGFWIESGEIAFPVHEVTLASGLLDLFSKVTGIGNELTFDFAKASPYLLISEMSLSGK